MKLHHLPSDDTLVRVALQGMLDLPGVTAVETAFLVATAARGRNSIVDMSEVTFIASLGLGMLIGCSKALHRKGAKLILLSPHPDVLHVIAVSGLLEMLLIAQNEDDISRLLASHVTES